MADDTFLAPGIVGALRLSLDLSTCMAIGEHTARNLANGVSYNGSASALDAAPDDGYLTPSGAAAYLGVKAKRVYDLKSMGAIKPDGHDGRTPLFTRATLDAYVRSA